MPISFETIAVLLLVAFLYGVLLAFIFKAVSWLLSHLYKYLSKYTWIKGIGDYLSTHSRKGEKILAKWWRRKLPNLANIFEKNYELFGDIVVIGFGLGVMVERIHDIQGKASNLLNFTGLILVDMFNNYFVWGIFGILLVLWLLGRRMKYFSDKKREKTLSSIDKTLKKLNTTLKDISQNHTARLEEIDKKLDELSIPKETKLKD